MCNASSSSFVKFDEWNVAQRSRKMNFGSRRMIFGWWVQTDTARLKQMNMQRGLKVVGNLSNMQKHATENYAAGQLSLSHTENAGL